METGSLDGSGSGSGIGSRGKKKSRVISYGDASRLFQSISKNEVKGKPLFYLDLATFNSGQGLTKTQRDRIKFARWAPNDINGVDFVAAFVNVMWPICTDVEQVCAFFEATSVTEDGRLRKVSNKKNNNLCSSCDLFPNIQTKLYTVIYIVIAFHRSSWTVSLRILGTLRYHLKNLVMNGKIQGFLGMNGCSKASEGGLHQYLGNLDFIFLAVG